MKNISVISYQSQVLNMVNVIRIFRLELLIKQSITNNLKLVKKIIKSLLSDSDFNFLKEKL